MWIASFGSYRLGFGAGPLQVCSAQPNPFTSELKARQDLSQLLKGRMSVGLVTVLSMCGVARNASVGLEHEEVDQVLQQHACVEALLEGQYALSGEVLDGQTRLDPLEWQR